MKKLLLLAAFFLIQCQCIVAAQPETNNKVTVVSGNIISIPDSNFRKALINHDTNHNTSYGITDFGSETVNVPDLSVVTELKLAPLSGDTSKIRDLTGIGSFTDLENLYCQDNEIDSLDLSNNTKLTFIDCKKSNIRYLDISGCSDLEELIAYINNLKTVDVSQNPNLTFLHFTGNDLEALDVSQNTLLEILYVNFNDLDTLDISQNTLLEDIDCSFNPLDTLDISNNLLLTRLGCASLNLDTIDVSHLSDLETFFCYKNNLTNINVSSNTKLSSFECNENNLSSLDVSSNTQLSLLDCSENLLSSLDLSKNDMLNELDCHFNDLMVLNVVKSLNLTDLDCRQNAGVGVDFDMDTLYVHKDQVISNLSIDPTTIIDTSGNSSVVIETIEDLKPKVYKLGQNYPNPFNPTTTIKVYLKERCFASLNVYDVLGRQVETLMNGYQRPGTYQLTFNAESLSSGIYFYKLQINNEKAMTRPMILLK
jgi:Leucine-rich repeat (LRR) protein